MALQLVGFCYSSSQTFSSIPQENLQEEETHKHCEAKQLIQKNLAYPRFTIGELIKKAWPEQFLKDSISKDPATPPPRFLLA